MAQLDLRQDFEEVLAFVRERVRSFNPKTNDGPGKGKLVARIDVGYQCDQAGWVALIFDTRAKAEPDGSWNSHITANTLERPDWLSAFETLGEKGITIVLSDAKEKKLRKESFDQLTTILGELLRDVLIRARADGVFADLPKAARCEMGVEEHDGAYGWPVYEKRELGLVG